jgi:paraquat-inducible protein B
MPVTVVPLTVQIPVVTELKVTYIDRNKKSVSIELAFHFTPKEGPQMKRVAIMIMAALMMSASVSVFAAEISQEQKDECLLASRNCQNSVDSIQQKIKKLQNEIKKGDTIYSPDEIKKLNDKLKETEDMLDKMINTN